MELKELKLDIEHNYKDLSGAVTINKGVSKPSQQNGLMQTGFYLAILHYLGMVSLDDEESFKDLVEQCEAESGPMSIQGLYERYPGCPDDSDFDDARCV